MTQRELVYTASKGVMHYREGDTVQRIGTGYSGQPPYVNQVEAEGLRARGPIPRGRYRVHRPFDHVRLGPLCFFLEPYKDTPMQGRSGFLIHGDNRLGNQSASHGCIILPRVARAKIADLRFPLDLAVV